MPESYGDLRIPVPAGGTEIVFTPDGTPAVAKGHSGPEPDGGRTRAAHADAVRRERAWLQSVADVEGVVGLAEWSDASQVATVYVGRRTLRSDLPTPAATARLLAAVCETLEALSDRGVAHGSLVAEHIILRSDGSPVLCSPSSAEPGPSTADDLRSLGRLIGQCRQHWADRGEAVEDPHRWDDLAVRLSDGEPTLGLVRTKAMLTDLSDGQPSRDGRTRPPLRVFAAIPALVLGAVALWIRAAPDPATATGPELTYQGVRIRIGSEGDSAVAIEPTARCAFHGIYVLDPDSSWVWQLDEPIDLDRSPRPDLSPVVMVPGAVELRLIGDPSGCEGLEAAGPAGTVRID